MKEKESGVEGALHATRAAVEEGIVPGGGVALIRAQRALVRLKLRDADAQIGVAIIRRAIEEPLRMIVQNAGGERSIVVEQVRASIASLLPTTEALIVENEGRSAAWTAGWRRWHGRDVLGH